MHVLLLFEVRHNLIDELSAYCIFVCLLVAGSDLSRFIRSMYTWGVYIFKIIACVFCVLSEHSV